jgi:hypothetical protein
MLLLALAQVIQVVAVLVETRHSQQAVMAVQV